MHTKGRVALVTGAAGRGMGRSIALTLAREGAKVVVNYRSSHDSAQQVVDHIQAIGGQAIAIRADIQDPQACQQMVQVTQEQMGPIDICIIGPGCDWRPAPIEKIDPIAATEDVVHEVAPLFNLMPLILPGMYERRWGRIVGLCLNSIHLPPAYAYNAAKAARAHALQLMLDQAWSHQVTVNVVAPGPVSEIASFDRAVELSQHGAAWKDRQGVTPQDIAEGVAFLCSESGRYVSGGQLPYFW